MIAASFLLGSLVVLLILIRLVFDSHSVLVDQSRVDAQHWAETLKTKTKEFEEITRRASEANLSLGQSIMDFDLKIKDLENRVAMVRMQR